MNLNHDVTERRMMLPAQMLAGVMVTLVTGYAGAQTPASDSAKPIVETYQTFYLNNTQQNDASEIQNDLRNMIPRARVFYVPSQGAISLHGTAEDVQLAEKILSETDKAKKVYRLTYAITETDGGKSLGTQHFSLIVVSGGKTVLKQGNRVPIVTGSTDDAVKSGQTSQVQYLDVGLNIDASLDGVRLHTEVEQSGISEEKSGVGVQDPVIRQATLDGTSILSQGKPVVLGSFDVPGSSRKQEIEVVAELVK